MNPRYVVRSDLVRMDDSKCDDKVYLGGSNQNLTNLEPVGNNSQLQWMLRINNKNVTFSVSVNNYQGDPFHLVQFTGTLLVNTELITTQTTAMALSKHDQNGTLEFVRTMWTYSGIRENQQYSQLCFDSAGNIYIMSVFTGSIILNNGKIINGGINSTSGTVLIIKASPDGTILWDKTIDGTSGQTNQMAVDPQGNVYVVGTFIGFLQLSPSDSPLTSTDSPSNFYTLKLKTDGTIDFVLSAGSEGSRVNS
ncbi:unnamed protein product, partial [marine sediment metagenome]